MGATSLGLGQGDLVIGVEDLYLVAFSFGSFLLFLLLFFHFLHLLLFLLLLKITVHNCSQHKVQCDKCSNDHYAHEVDGGKGV